MSVSASLEKLLSFFLSSLALLLPDFLILRMSATQQIHDKVENQYYPSAKFEVCVGPLLTSLSAPHPSKVTNACGDKSPPASTFLPSSPKGPLKAPLQFLNIFWYDLSNAQTQYSTSYLGHHPASHFQPTFLL